METRIEICRKCEHFIKATQQCGDCWCFMPAKVLMPSAECPKQKWGKKDDTNQS
jgi:hypothetical protein